MSRAEVSSAGTDFVFPNYPLAAVSAPLGQISRIAVDTAGDAVAAKRVNGRFNAVVLSMAGNERAGNDVDHVDRSHTPAELLASQNALIRR
jgi:hypothetical protein